MTSVLNVSFKHNCYGKFCLHTESNIDPKRLHENLKDKGTLIVKELEYKKHNIDLNKNVKTIIFQNHILKIYYKDNIYISLNHKESYDVDIIDIFVQMTIHCSERLSLKNLNHDFHIDETMENSTYKYNIICHTKDLEIHKDINLLELDNKSFDLKSSVLYIDEPLQFAQTLNKSKYRFTANITGIYTQEDVDIINKTIEKWTTIIYGPLLPSLDQEMLININFQELEPYILGSAYVQTIYTIDDGYVSVEGTITLNTVNWESQKQLVKTDGLSNAYYTLLHEIGHILGIGTLFTDPSTGDARANLIDNENNYRYIGKYGLEKYKVNIGDNSLTCIPLEDDYGGGTAGGHLEEGLESTNGTKYFDGVLHPGLDRELMTGISENDNEPEILSTITAGILHDLGFIVKYSACDDVLLPKWVNYNNSTHGIFNYTEILIITIFHGTSNSVISFTNTNQYNYSNIRVNLSSYSSISKVRVSCGAKSEIYMYGYTLEYPSSTVVKTVETQVISGSNYYDAIVTQSDPSEMLIHLKTIKGF